MRYAILIGINNYEDMINLDYCYRDAEALSGIFQYFCHMEKESVKRILSSNESPNYDCWGTFKTVISKMKDVFIPGIDDLYFYFSGHGVSGQETTVVFGKEIHTITEIMKEIDELNPKTRIMIFDSCHSGAGLPEKDRSAIHFAHSTASSYGYCLLAAAAPDQKAKESSTYEHGKFTYFLIQTIADRQNYDRNACLDVNTLFSKVNTFFAEHPEFKQTPTQQIKTVGSYPIATAVNEEHFYVRFDRHSDGDFDWEALTEAYPKYLDISQKMAGEFSRYLVEHLQNTADPAKGKATLESIELTKNKVTLIDNGSFFDLFEPSAGITPGGGVKTAAFLKSNLADEFNYACSTDGNLNTYTFSFKELNPADQCFQHLTWKQYMGRQQPPIIIDENCPHFTFKFERYTLNISMMHPMIANCKAAAEKYQKIIYLELPKGDWVIEDLIGKINQINAGEWVKIRLYE